MGGWGSCGVSANEYSCAHGAQINFGDLTPYLPIHTVVLAGGGGDEDDPIAEKNLTMSWGLFIEVETYSCFEVEIYQQGVRTPLAGE